MRFTRYVILNNEFINLYRLSLVRQRVASLLIRGLVVSNEANEKRKGVPFKKVKNSQREPFTRERNGYLQDRYNS